MYSFSHYFTDKPKVAISFGRSINAYQIKEGDDVYFECRILAYPHAKKVTWMHNVSSKIVFRTPSTIIYIVTRANCLF